MKHKPPNIYIMDTNKVKELHLYNTKVISLFVVIIIALCGSCSTDEEEVISIMNDPEEAEVNAPIIQTPAPLIHLADNLDEQDQLGWCIDTRGNGFNETLHTHSCKPGGGDVQFFYNEETLQICSVDYTDFCVEMPGGPIRGMSLSLVASNADSPEQNFIFNENSGEFRPEADTSLCLAAGDISAIAGIYMSRSLTLELSSETEKSLKKWVIIDN